MSLAHVFSEQRQNSRWFGFENSPAGQNRTQPTLIEDYYSFDSQRMLFEFQPEVDRRVRSATRVGSGDYCACVGRLRVTSDLFGSLRVLTLKSFSDNSLYAYLTVVD